MTVDLRITGEVQKLHLDPEDVILVKLDTPLGQRNVMEIQKEAESYFLQLGFKNRVMVLSGVSISVAKKK